MLFKCSPTLKTKQPKTDNLLKRKYQILLPKKVQTIISLGLLSLFRDIYNPRKVDMAHQPSWVINAKAILVEEQQ